MTGAELAALAARCREEDEPLTGVVVRDADLSGLDLSDLQFSGGEFQRCRFGDCDCSGGHFADLRLEGCDLSNGRFSATRWADCALTGCKAVGIDLRESRLLRTVFSGCLLRYANLSGCRMSGVVWTDCVLAGAILASCALGAEFHGCDLTEVSLFRTPLKGLDLSSCRLDGLVVSESGEELRGLTVDLWQAAGLARRLGILIKE